LNKNVKNLQRLHPVIPTRTGGLDNGFLDLSISQISLRTISDQLAMAWDQQGAFPSLGGGASAGGQTASIFAALALAPTSKPRTAAATTAATASAAAPTPDPSLGPLGYFVTGSKKGAFPVGLEKRGCGKKVTVVKNVVGDAGALLQALKKRLGCGGAVCPGGSSVEVQGERKAEVERFLADAGCVKAVSGAHKAAAAPAKAGAQKVAAPTRLDRKFAMPEEAQQNLPPPPPPQSARAHGPRPSG
jgi:translation initiation factor 1 (eIF-1/SUI1)